MDAYSQRQEILKRIAELIEDMPEDDLLQLIQRWEAELSELLANNSIIMLDSQDKSYISDKT